MPIILDNEAETKTMDDPEHTPGQVNANVVQLVNKQDGFECMFEVTEKKVDYKCYLTCKLNGLRRVTLSLSEHGCSPICAMNGAADEMMLILRSISPSDWPLDVSQ